MRKVKRKERKQLVEGGKQIFEGERANIFGGYSKFLRKLCQ